MLTLNPKSCSRLRCSAPARYLPNGALDVSFGDLGKAVLLDNNLTSGFRACYLHPDGRLLTAAFLSKPPDKSLSLRVKRWTPDGQPDDASPLSDTYLLDDLDATLYGNEYLFWTQDLRLLYAGSRYRPNSDDLDIVAARYVFDGMLLNTSPVRQKSEIQIHFSPNPTTTATTVTALSDKQIRGILTVTAVNGSVMWSQNLDLQAGIAESKPLPVVYSWPAGQYFWSFIPEDGTAVDGRFIKL